MAIQKGLEPSISSVTGRHVNHYTTGPFINLVAGGRFELPTSGLWARRATTALPRDIDEQVYNGGGRGIRTPAPVSRSTGFQDRTLQPLGYSSNIMVDPVGLEPTTDRLWAGSSNHWAKGPSLVAAGGLEPSTYRVWTGRSKPTGLHRQHFTRCSLFSIKVVEPTGIEPATSCLQGRRSSRWAKAPFLSLLVYNTIILEICK